MGAPVNALWPKTVIATAAVQNLLVGDEVMKRSRRPSIMADAAYLLLTRNSRECTGNLFLDEEVLRAAGMTEFEKYSLTPGIDLIPDFVVLKLSPIQPPNSLFHLISEIGVPYHQSRVD